jgi:hypothetical protein
MPWNRPSENERTTPQHSEYGVPGWDQVGPSVGSKGAKHDRALPESVIGLFGTEVIRREGPRRTMEDVEFPTLNWVGQFKFHRLVQLIEHVPPAEYARANYQRQKWSIDKAGLKQTNLR